MIDLKSALARAKDHKRFENELRESLIYALEQADVDVVIELGKHFDRILDDAAKCPTQSQTLTTNQPEPKRRGRSKRRG